MPLALLAACLLSLALECAVAAVMAKRYRAFALWCICDAARSAVILSRVLWLIHIGSDYSIDWWYAHLFAWSEPLCIMGMALAGLEAGRITLAANPTLYPTMLVASAAGCQMLPRSGHYPLESLFLARTTAAASTAISLIAVLYVRRSIHAVVLLLYCLLDLVLYVGLVTGTKVGVLDSIRNAVLWGQVACLAAWLVWSISASARDPEFSA